jgi:hypothetical protein
MFFRKFITSGYRDGALYIDGQNESYPSMIAQQMKLAGGGDFKQPLMADNNGGFFPQEYSDSGYKTLYKGFVDGALIGPVNDNKQQI